MEPDLKLVGEYVSWENINMLIEMRSQLAKRANMNQETIKNALTDILEDLNAVEENLSIKLGPKRFPNENTKISPTTSCLSYSAKRRGEAKQALLESAKLRQCLG